jgi:hypothetical protein
MILDGLLIERSPIIAAVNSMRLLVVFGSPPLRVCWWPFSMTTTPQPPLPGLGSQAPSV